MGTLYSAIARRTVFPILDRMRDIPIERERRRLEKSQWWEPSRILQLQEMRLRRLITHAYSNVPYYRRVMIERGLRPTDIRTISDLSKLPILTKEIVRREQENLESSQFDQSAVTTGHTGGSTGEPLTYYHDHATQATNRAAHRRGFAWSGIEWGDPLVAFFGGTLGLAPTSLAERIRCRVTRQTFYPAFELGPRSIGGIYSLLREAHPRAISGYASSIHYLAMLLADAQHLDLHIPVAFTTGETLAPECRQTIEEVLHTRVSDYYGFGEVQAIAYQCPDSHRYHLTNEKVILELAELPGYIPGKLGRGIFTDLTNYSFPLIRYESGDVLELSDKPCECGRGLTAIERIHGRLHDFIVLQTGELLAGEFFPHLFRSSRSIRYYQIVQPDIRHLEVRYIPSDSGDISADIELLSTKICQYTHNSLVVQFKQVSEIPRTPSGKLRVTISHVDPFSVDSSADGRANSDL